MSDAMELFAVVMHYNEGEYTLAICLTEKCANDLAILKTRQNILRDMFWSVETISTTPGLVDAFTVHQNV